MATHCTHRPEVTSHTAPAVLPAHAALLVQRKGTSATSMPTSGDAASNTSKASAPASIGPPPTTEAPSHPATIHPAIKPRDHQERAARMSERLKK